MIASGSLHTLSFLAARYLCDSLFLSSSAISPKAFFCCSTSKMAFLQVWYYVPTAHNHDQYHPYDEYHYVFHLPAKWGISSWFHNSPLKCYSGKRRGHTLTSPVNTFLLLPSIKAILQIAMADLSCTLLYSGSATHFPPQIPSKVYTCHVLRGRWRSPCCKVWTCSLLHSHVWPWKTVECVEE